MFQTVKRRWPLKKNVKAVPANCFLQVGPMGRDGLDRETDERSNGDMECFDYH